MFEKLLGAQQTRGVQQIGHILYFRMLQRHMNLINKIEIMSLLLPLSLVWLKLLNMVDLSLTLTL